MLLTVVAFCCGLVIPVVGQNAAGDAGDEAAVRAVVAKYVDARERRDARALEALFTDDADQFTTGGEWRRGRDRVVGGGLASSAQNPGTRRIAVEAVRFPAPGVAIADGRYEIGAQRNWTTIVLTRVASGEWRITAIRNMAQTRPAAR